MNGCCPAYADVVGAHFNDKRARQELANYRQKGPGSATRLLRNMLVASGRINGVLLDVGSGIGALMFELLECGIDRAIAVDASGASLAAAKEEAVRRGRGGAVEFVHGDFLDVAPQIPTATVFTLDRVICCYPAS